MTAPTCAWAKAPGKVIIAGEHAVIYGQPALACAINLTTMAKCQWQTTSAPIGTITLCLPHQQWQVSYTLTQLKAFTNAVITRYQGFLQGRLTQQQVLPNQGDLLVAAIGFVCYFSGIDQLQYLETWIQNKEIRINITTELLLGSGMGSSASLVAASLGALLIASQKPVNDTQPLTKTLSTQGIKDILFALTYQCEQWQHGRSSGLDPTVCVYGGGWMMQQGQSTPINMPAIAPLFIVNTGAPDATTGECVQYVAQRFGEGNDKYPVDENVKVSAIAPWCYFGEVTNTIKTLFTQASATKVCSINTKAAPSLLAAFCENQRLLQNLGVVPDNVIRFVKEIEKHQCAAKISGAGSTKGQQAGLVLVAGMEEITLAPLCQAYGYSYWSLQPQHEGISFGYKHNTKPNLMKYAP